MAEFLDKNGLEKVWGKIKQILNLKADKDDIYSKQNIDDKLNLKADKDDTYSKQNIDDKIKQVYGNITDVSCIIANSTNDIKNSVGLDENLNTSFNGTENINNCNSIVDAIFKLDAELLNTEDLHYVITEIFGDNNSYGYGSEGSGNEPIGDFEPYESDGDSDGY